MMPSDRTETPRDDSTAVHPHKHELPLRPARQIAPPLGLDGPEALRDSHC
jgi:hypothetical protein